MSAINILQITTHDSGRHFGCYGHPTLRTPHIDGLAADGVTFTNDFCTVPICSASRASQLTGLYPQNHGLLDLVGFGWRMHDRAVHLAQALKDNGYGTFLFGVHHEVSRDDLPRLGFDAVRPAREDARDVAADVVGFLRIRGRTERPFYAQVGFVQTHTPFDRGGVRPDTSGGVAVPPYLAQTDAARCAMAGYQGAVHNVDTAVGTIMEALRDRGLLDNALVVVTTDHGIEMPRAKWHLYDPGIAIGLVMRCPSAGLCGGRACDLLASNVDYLPTVMDLAGVQPPGGLDGLSFAEALRQDDAPPPRDAVFGLYHKTQTRYVRTDRYKLIRHFDNASDFHSVPVHMEEVLNKRVIDRVELFDLQADPNEFNNLAGKPACEKTQRQLDARLWSWMESVGDPLLEGPVRTPLYEEAMADYAAWKAAPEQA